MCQHPAVQAVYRSKQIADSCVGRSPKEVSSHLDEMFALARFGDEVVASEFVPKFSVGFFNGENNKVMFIWVWPLSGNDEYMYWTCDPKGWFKYPDGNHDESIQVSGLPG